MKKQLKKYFSRLWKLHRHNREDVLRELKEDHRYKMKKRKAKKELNICQE